MTKIYAHRGFSSVYPENSLEAIIEATKHDYIFGIEIDIRMTKDEKFVLIHNRDISNVSNGIGNVNDYTLDELKKLDFHINNLDYRVHYMKSFFNKDGHRIRKKLKKLKTHKFKVVTIEEILDIIDDKALLIEIKYIIGDNFNLEKLIQILNKYKDKNIMIQSFSKTIIKKLQKIDRNLNLGILIEDVQLEEKLKMKTNFISIKDSIVNNKVLTDSLYRKKYVNVWTIDYYKQLKKLVKKLDGKINEVGLITNNPDLIKKYLKLVNKK